MESRAHRSAARYRWDMPTRIPSWYIATLLIGGSALIVFGTLMPLGGGTALLAIGAAAIGAGLVLGGLRLGR